MERVGYQSNPASDRSPDSIEAQRCSDTNPLATPMREIDNPRMLDGRENLFSTLAYGQFTQEEMNTGRAWKIVSEA
jgi:hypothetical protein